MTPEARIVAGAAIIAVAALGALWDYGFPSACVRMPNGLNLGKAALLDLRGGLVTNHAVKFDDGRLLLTGGAWPLLVTETTVHGRSEPGPPVAFAWRADAGLVLRRDDPALYARLVAEAGPRIDGRIGGGFDEAIVFMTMREAPEYAGQTCRTRWIAW
ncbi:hypothetical protein ACQ5SO_00380 [Rhodovulum sp. DZ06]|uniref:hypothetical protein n=1 Tax=Rhodovulum sp. DZ06 TaxID=3425126 RepID=UPI003D348F5F